MQKTYSYPDADDKITNASFGGHDSPYARYWAQSEHRILELMKCHVAAHLKTLTDQPQDRPAFLDAGCGEGRLIPEFANMFKRVVGLEPDEHRLQRARSHALRAGLQGVEFVGTYVHEMSQEERFDVILSSHVLQHLRTTDTPIVLDALVERVAPGGLLLLTTCHSTRDRDMFEACQVQEGVARQREISAADFDRIVYADEDTLASRFFSASDLLEQLEARSLSIQVFRVFHVNERDLPDLTDGESDWSTIDDRVNSDPQRQSRHGEDMCIVARKRE